LLRDSGGSESAYERFRKRREFAKDFKRQIFTELLKAFRHPLTCLLPMRQKWGKEVSRSKKARNDMEERQEVRKVRRIFTPEQKFEILKDIERCKTIKEGLAKHQLAQSLYHKWKRQLEVGVRASLRNSRPLKSTDLKRLEAENRKLKEVVLNQAFY
jgi:transposase-like protein